jgi:hypothetical protein
LIIVYFSSDSLFLIPYFSFLFSNFIYKKNTMKKLLMGSVCLLIFSMSILVLQISCQKDIVAQTSGNPYVLPPATTSALGGVIIGSGLSVTADGTLSATGHSAALNKIVYRVKSGPNTGFWVANTDGTGRNPANPVLPAGMGLSDTFTAPFLSADGTKIFFIAAETTTGFNYRSVWSCNIDGSNPAMVIDPTSAEEIWIGGVY